MDEGNEGLGQLEHVKERWVRAAGYFLIERSPYLKSREVIVAGSSLILTL